MKIRVTSVAAYRNFLEGVTVPFEVEANISYWPALVRSAAPGKADPRDVAYVDPNVILEQFPDAIIKVQRLILVGQYDFEFIGE